MWGQQKWLVCRRAHNSDRCSHLKPRKEHKGKLLPLCSKWAWSLAHARPACILDPVSVAYITHLIALTCCSAVETYTCQTQGLGGISEVSFLFRESVPSFLIKNLLVCSCLISHMFWCHAVSVSQRGVALSPIDSSETGLRLCGTEKRVRRCIRSLITVRAVWQDILLDRIKHHLQRD